jgi:glycerol-3-phosphate dehydrogenase (NAD(P)+)
MTMFGVLGGGTWGLSLAKAARRAGTTPILCTRRHESGSHTGVTVTSDLGELAKAKIIIMAVPSHQAESAARQLGDHLNGNHFLIHGIRGLSGEGLTTVSQILRQETPVRRIGALGGPVQPDELSEGRPSAMVVASAFSDVRSAMAELLSGPSLHIRTTDDLVGLEWASALVGAVSIGVGFAQARPDISPGLLAALISSAVDESATIAVAAGAKRETFYGLGGYGDLLASIGMPNRPEVVLGRALAEGDNLEQAQQRATLRIEAIELIPRVVAFAKRRKVPHKVFGVLADVLERKIDGERVLASFF